MQHEIRPKTMNARDVTHWRRRWVFIYPPWCARGVSSPSTIPQGYRRPRTRFPFASTTVLLPITAKGMLSWWDEEEGTGWMRGG